MPTIPVWCEGCNAQGEISVKDLEGDYFVICETCGTQTAEVWCPEGQSGGQYVEAIKERPGEYICPMCGKTHSLPADFYNTFIPLKLIEAPRNVPFMWMDRFITYLQGVFDKRPYLTRVIAALGYLSWLGLSMLFNLSKRLRGIGVLLLFLGIIIFSVFPLWKMIDPSPALMDTKLYKFINKRPYLTTFGSIGALIVWPLLAAKIGLSMDIFFIGEAFLFALMIFIFSLTPN